MILKLSVYNKPREKFTFTNEQTWMVFVTTKRYRDSFLSSDHSHMSVNDMWVSFKSEVLAAIERFIPSKMTKTKYSSPWIDSSIKRLIKRRDRLYFRARKSSSPDIKSHYKRFRAHVQKVIRDAYWKHISGIFSFDTDSADPDCPRKNEKAKKFWSFVKSLKKDVFGINSLRENGILKTDTLDKANICNDPKGVLKLLNNLNIHKASGPDGLSARVLKECSSEISHSPMLALIYNESLAQGTVPDDWPQANVAPVFKKGETYNAANYRPVSLTCICCKTLEHIIVSNINKHLAFESILADCQHGFRSQRSCETQLVQFYHDMVSNLDGARDRGQKQTDVIIMDFAKAPPKKLCVSGYPTYPNFFQRP